MNVYILDDTFSIVDVVDSYISLIWTTRYYTYGDFELYVMASTENVDLLQVGRYLVREQDITDGLHHVMIIENVRITTDVENGNGLIVSGREWISVLHRRVIPRQTVATDTTIADLIQLYLEENAVAPSGVDATFRIISILGIDTPQIETSVSITKQETGGNLGEVITELCMVAGYGCETYFNGTKMMFVLHEGADRSFEQSTNPHIIFSESFDNLLSTDYTQDRTDYANMAYVAGEGEGISRKIYPCGEQFTRGLNRYEIWVDAPQISSNDGEIPEAIVNEMLDEQGQEALKDRAVTIAFEGSVNNDVNYELGVDYFLGDIVQVVNAYGISLPTRITEIIESDSVDGYQMIPTFSYEGGQ